MLTLHLCIALTQVDFHVGNFLLSNTVLLNKAGSPLVHHINMPEHGLTKVCVTFPVTYHFSLKAITEKYGILLVPIFSGKISKKRPPSGAHRHQPCAENKVIKAGAAS